MTSAPRFAALVVLAAVAGGCFERVDDGLDRVPPRVVGVSPAQPTVPVTTEFTIALSEPIDATSVDAVADSETISVVLAPRDVVTDAFITDINSPGLIESRQDDIVPITTSVRDDRILITPSILLQPRTAYSIVVSERVRDAAGNPIVDALGLAAAFRYDVSTDAGAPAVASTDLGTSLVPLNRRRITITFNQPVRDVGETTVSFSPAVGIEAVLLDEARTVATVFIAAGQGGCARLAADTSYTLAVSEGVIADTGQALQPFSTTFQTSAACDTAPHRLTEPSVAIAGEVAATVRFTSSKPSTTAVRFGVDGGPLDCLGQRCPVVGVPARTADGVAFRHAVELTGLTVNTTYRAAVTAEDDVGGVAFGELTFLTEPLPKLAVNEVMVDPAGTENQGEYIELANFGDVGIDVTGWVVEVTGSSTCTATLAERTIPVGGFALVTGNAFVAATYGLGDDAPIARSASQNICGSGLLNDGVQVVLKEPSGRPISSFGKHVSPAEGRSIERLSPDAADVAASFCLSRTDAGPTPTRQNGIVAQGCH